MTAEFTITCEWGLHGLQALAPSVDAIIIVDVLSFSTCVDIAVGRGAVVFPFAERGDAAREYAESNRALLAGDNPKGYALAPASLLNIESGTRLVLPSPNGSTLSLAAPQVPTFTGCLRNARAVAEAARQVAERIAVIPAGERWRRENMWDDTSLRPALEDWIGAGAILDYLPGPKSPEATAAQSNYLLFRKDLLSTLRSIPSGVELIEKGLATSLDLAAELNVSDAAPRLIDGAYKAAD